MPTRNVLVVAVDGLRAAALGAYGNTMFPTPALDEFSANSFLLDWCYAPGSELREVYRALWQSAHPATPQAESAAALSLPRLFSERHYATMLVTDEPQMALFASAADFSERVQADDTSASASARSDDASHTSIARLFAAACDAVAAASTTAPRLIWVHSRGMYGPWDAPLDLQRSLLDEGDPPPVDTISPPDFSIGDNDDPDAAFRYATAYAAQVMVLDTCLEGLLETVQGAGADQKWLIILLGARGYPLGEHRRIGGHDPRLYAEQLHVPWLLRFPDGRGQLARSGQLTSPLDLLPTLVDWIGVQAPRELDGMSVLPLIGSAAAAWRDSLIAVSGAGHRAIRTAEWSLRQDAAGEQPPELYVRPDDRWEFNDVAKLCPEEIESLARSMDEQLPPA